MSIRIAQTEDIEKLVRLYSRIQGNENVLGENYGEAFFHRYLEDKGDTLVLVAENRGEITGSLSADVDTGASLVYVVNAIVHPEERRKGVGRDLFRTMWEVCSKRGIENAIHTTYENNHVANKLSLDLGYTPSKPLINFVKRVTPENIQYLTRPDVSVRFASDKDIPVLKEIYNGVKEIQNFDDESFDDSFFEGLIASNSLLVAEQKNCVVGGLDFVLDPFAKYFFINNVIVAKEKRSLGIGAHLFKRAEELALEKGLSRVIGLVYAFNKNMPLSRVGYENTGNVIIYSKELK